MKRCSTPYVIRKCKLKQRDTSTHLLEWPKSRTLTTSTQPGCGATGTLIYCWWECNVVQPLRKTVRQDLTKLNRLLSYDPAITPLEIYPKKLKTRPHKNLHMDDYSKTGKQPRCPSVSDWINTRWYNQTVEYYSALKRNELSSHKKDMKETQVHITKWKKSTCKGYVLYDPNYMTF